MAGDVGLCGSWFGMGPDVICFFGKLERSAELLSLTCAENAAVPRLPSCSRYRSLRLSHRLETVWAMAIVAAVFVAW